MTIEVTSVSVSFGTLSVLKNISCSFSDKEPTILLGRNGAGKPTLLSVISGVTTIQTGSVTRSTVGYVRSEPLVYFELTVKENLQLFGTLLKQPYQTAVDFWELESYLNVPVKDLSSGTKARVGLARAMMSQANALILDEPSSALDDYFCNKLISFIEGCSGVVIVATHDLHRLQKIAKRVVVLEGGAIAIDSRTSSIESAVSFYAEKNR